MKNRREQYKIIIYIILILGAVVMVFPFIWMLSTSLRDGNPDGFSFLPKPFTMNNFKKAIFNDNLLILKSMFNTLVIVVLKLFGEVIVSALVAYGFARFQFKFKNTLFLILLATMMLPYEVTMMPTYIFWTALGFSESYVPLILPSYFGSATFIFFMRMYYSTFPKDIEESALIEGAGYLQIFRRIFIPMSIPALITLSLWSFMGTWNDLLGQMIYISEQNKFTIQLFLESLSSFTAGEPPIGLLMASSAVALLPVIFILLYVQKYFVEGIKLTGIKG